MSSMSKFFSGTVKFTTFLVDFFSVAIFLKTAWTLSPFRLLLLVIVFLSRKLVGEFALSPERRFNMLNE